MSDTPAGWPSFRFGQLLSPRYGKALPPHRRNEVGAIPVVGSAGVMSFTETPLISGPVIVIGRKGSIGRNFVYSDGCWPIDTTYYATIPERIHPTFLAYQLSQVDWRSLNASTTTPSLRREDLEAVPLSLPCLAVQLRVVDLLDDHLSHIDAAEAQLRVSQRRAERTGAGAFEAEIRSARHDGEAAKPSPVGTDDSGLPAIPASWSWRRLGDIADVVGGVTKDAKRQADPSHVEVPYLRVANVQRGHLDLTSLTTIRVPQAKIDQLRLLPGDVLLNEGGDRDKLGRGWVWEGHVDPCIHQNHVFRARIRDDAVLPELLSLSANSIGGRWCQRNGTQSVNLASISLKKIRQMPVAVPPRAEQPAILARVLATRAAVARLSGAVGVTTRRSGALRRSLMEAAFTGRLS